MRHGVPWRHHEQRLFSPRHAVTHQKHHRTASWGTFQTDSKRPVVASCTEVELRQGRFQKSLPKRPCRTLRAVLRNFFLHIGCSQLAACASYSNNVTRSPLIPSFDYQGEEITAPHFLPMNYFQPRTWLHPEIETVCRQVLVPAFLMDYKGIREFKHKTKDFWERNFQFVSRDAFRPALLDVCVPSTSSVAFNLLLPEKKETFTQSLYFNVAQGRFQMGRHKDNPTQADFDSRVLARGLYFLGHPIEKLEVFGISRHEEVEWIRPRHEAWLSLGELCPDGIE